MFDARAAKLLAPGAHLTITDAPGLRLQATQSTRTWVYRYKSPVDGRMRQIKLGAWPVMTYQAAWVAWDKARTVRDGGADPAMEKRAARSNAAERAKVERQQDGIARYLVTHVCSDYISWLTGRRKAKGVDEVQRLFDRHLGALATVTAATVNRSQAFQLISGMAETPVLASQLRRELGAAWEHAIDAGRLPEDTPNWWRQILRGKLRSKGKKIAGQSVGTAKRVLSADEIGELIRWLPNFSRNVADALTMYLWTGSRGGEFLKMRRQHITQESDGWWFTLPAAETKGGWRDNPTDYRVPLVGRALQIVQRRLGATDGEFVFPAARAGGEPYLAQKSVSSQVHYHMPYSETRPEAVRPRLTVSNWAAHDLRRSVKTLLTAMGCPSDVSESVLGHKLEGIEGVYNRHHYDPEKRHWLVLLDAKLEQISG